MLEHRIVYEEVPGSRTTQETVVDPQRKRIAYEDLQPGDIIQEGDEWQNECGRWQPFLVLDGSRVQVRQSQRVRRPHNIAAMQNERDELRAEMDTVKGDRMNLREALAAEQRAHTVTMTSGLQVCKERDEALAEVAKLSAELWARRPLEERVASLTDELANARENMQKLVKANADNADQFAEHTKFLVHERDEARAEVQRLQEVVRTLHSEPMAWQVQQMLGTWITELNWSVGCFGSFGRAQVDIIQQTMTAVIQRIETMIHPEGNTNRDEARAEVQRLQEVVRTLHSEPMAWQVQQMLGTWITAIDWSAGCFDSAGREQIDTIQKTLIAVMERIGILNPEGNTDGE